MDALIQEKYANIVSKATSDDSGCVVLFVSDLDIREFSNVAKSAGLKYVYVPIGDTEQDRHPLLKVARELMSNLPEIKDTIPLGDSILKGSLLDQSTESYLIHSTFDRLENTGVKYLVHLHPLSNICEHDSLKAFFDSCDVNRTYRNVKFAILSNKEEVLQTDVFKCFNKVNLNQTEKMKQVFISYSWKEPSNHIVQNNIEPALVECGADYVLDKNDCYYHTNIPEFEQRIGNGETIIAVVSNPYLRSIQCMYEMALMFETGNVRDRVYPVCLDDFNRNDDKFYCEVVAYWRKKEAETQDYCAMVGEPENEPFKKDIEYISLIRKHLGKFWIFLKDTNSLTLTELGRNNFEKLKAAIGYEVREAVLDNNINLKTTGVTNNFSFVFNGGTPQVNTNTGNGIQNVSNDYSAEVKPRELSDEHLEEIAELVKTNYLTDNISAATGGPDEGFVYAETLKICHIFKDMVEKSQMSKLFYRNGRIPDETDWQLLLYSIGRTYQKASNGNYHISREDNPGCGEIDLHVTKGNEANICLEMKLSSNTTIVHGYVEQLRGYMGADGAKKGIYIIIEQDDSHQQDIQKVLEMKKVNDEKGVYSPEVIIVNGRVQVSASKPAYVAPE